MITLSFTDREMQAMFAILDLAVKAGGLGAASGVNAMHQKFIAAIQMAQSAPEPTTEG